jgi:hypothetical protein
MNINNLTDNITYYSGLTATFEEERDALTSAGIWSVRGLLEPMEGTLDLWVDSVGIQNTHEDSWIPDNEISDRRVFDPGKLSKFDKMINDCIQEYKNSHSIDKESAPVVSTSVKRYKKGHNLRTHSVGEGYYVVCYLNNDYVGGQISFSSKKEPSINPLVHPKYPENIDQIDSWIKPEPCTVVIMPSSTKVTEHVISSWDRYTISAGF